MCKGGCGTRSRGGDYCRTCKSKIQKGATRAAERGILVGEAGGSFWAWDSRGDVLEGPAESKGPIFLALSTLDVSFMAEADALRLLELALVKGSTDGPWEICEAFRVTVLWRRIELREKIVDHLYKAALDVQMHQQETGRMEVIAKRAAPGVLAMVRPVAGFRIVRDQAK